MYFWELYKGCAIPCMTVAVTTLCYSYPVLLLGTKAPITMVNGTDFFCFGLILLQQDGV